MTKTRKSLVLYSKISSTFQKSTPPKLLDNWLIRSLLIGFCLNLLLQTLFCSFATSDFAEQALWTQSLNLGYGVQPPLYTYLQIIFFKIFGVSFFSLQLLQQLIVLATSGFLYLFFKNCFTQDNSSNQGSNKAITNFCILISLSQLFVSAETIDIITRTHTSLATLMGAILLYVFSKLYYSDSWKNYCLLGLVAAAGVLSKYNFLIFVLVMLGVTLSFSNFRKITLSRKFIASGLTFMACLLPNLWWLLQNKELLLVNLHQKVYKASIHLALQPDTSYQKLLKHAKGAFVAVDELVMFFIPVLIVISLILLIGWLWQTITASSGSQTNTLEMAESKLISESLSQNNWLSFLLRLFFSSLAIVIVCACIFKVTRIRGYWFQPLFTYFSALLICFLYKYKIFGNRPQKLLQLTLAAVLIISPIGKAAYVGLVRNTKFMDKSDVVAMFINQINNNAANRASILSTDKNIAGNLRLAFPKQQVIWLGDKYHSKYSLKGKVIFVGLNQKDDEAFFASLNADSMHHFVRVIEKNNPSNKRMLHNQDLEISLWQGEAKHKS